MNAHGVFVCVCVLFPSVKTLFCSDMAISRYRDYFVLSRSGAR